MLLCFFALFTVASSYGCVLGHVDDSFFVSILTFFRSFTIVSASVWVWRTATIESVLGVMLMLCFFSIGIFLHSRRSGSLLDRPQYAILPLMGWTCTADGCRDAPAGADPPASLPLPSSDSYLTIHISFCACVLGPILFDILHRGLALIYGVLPHLGLLEVLPESGLDRLSSGLTA